MSPCCWLHPACLVYQETLSLSFDNRLFQLTMAGVTGVIIWILLRPSVLAPRYILATLIAFLPLAGRGVECALSAAWRGRLFGFTILFCCVGMLAHEVGAVNKNARRALDLLTGKYTVCEMSGGFCTASEVINREAAEGDRVFMGGYCSFWLRSDLLQNISRGEEQGSVSTQKKPEAAWDMLGRLGFRYALIFRVTHPACVRSLDSARTPQGCGWTSYLIRRVLLFIDWNIRECRTPPRPIFETQ
jgi:hypothetical protein